jgi:hypothetical protein
MITPEACAAAEASTAALAAATEAPAAPPSTQAAAGPSDAPDADTEALAWALHRELNGLTRSSRRGGHKAPPGGGRGGASGAGSFDVSRLSSRRTSNTESRQRSPGASLGLLGGRGATAASVALAQSPRRPLLAT